jgi:hypothetical protein
LRITACIPQAEQNEANTCNKEETWDNKKMPGLFILLCPHGVCYGFCFMLEHESPKTLFNILFNRFTVAPHRLIYDNACHIDKYAEAREPGFFSRTQFLIDKLHIMGHCKWVHSAI